MEVMSLTAPSSPRHFSGNYFLSAPTTPRRITEFYNDFHNHSDRLTIPFDWEETPGTPRKINNQTDELVEQDDFAFDIGEKSETTSLFAEELFDGGKIKPLKPPPCLHIDTQINNSSWTQDSSSSSPKSPISIFRKAFSPRKKPLEVDPFETAIDNARKGLVREEIRGRDHSRRQNSTRRSARSLSPFRVSAYPWEEQEQEKEQKQEQEQSSCVSRKSTSRKWSLKDFLLFRSASEGRARHSKEMTKTFSGLFRKREEVKKSNSKGSSSVVSPHEFHYIAKKAENKEMKRKTFLPYMQIGRFAF